MPIRKVTILGIFLGLALLLTMSDESDEGASSGGEENGEEPAPRTSLLDDFYDRTLAGGKVTLAQYLCSAKLSSIKAGQSDRAFEENLKLQNEAFGSNIPIKAAMEIFKMMENDDSGLTYSFFCTQCKAQVCTSTAERLSEVKGKTYDCGSEACPEVKVDLTGNTSDVMVRLDIKKQLDMIYKLPQIENLLTPLEDLINRGDIISDIYDGLMYKKITQDETVEDIIVFHSADGLQVYESGPSSVWTDVFQIANLNPRDRQKPRFMILTCVMYCKNGSPPKEFFEENMEATIADIQKARIEWTYRGHPMLSKVFLGFSVDDLPARAKVFKVPPHSAYCGCTFCHIKGRYARTGRGGAVYFPADQGETLDRKTDAEARHNGLRAQFLNEQGGRDDVQVGGYTGPCAFSKIENFDVVSSCAIDKMHCCYEGVMKKYLQFWFKSSTDPYSLTPYMEQIQERLDKVHLTSESTRSTLKIKDHVHWKANQLRTFTFIGSVILAGILDDPYYSHFCLFSYSCHLLERDNITNDDIDDAERKLVKFWSDCPYDVNFITMNIHTAGYHVADSVRFWGPFFVTSMFPFENVMGILKKLVCGTVGVSNQIARKWMLKLNLELIEEKVMKDNQRAKYMFDVAHGYKKLVDPIVTNSGVVMSNHQRQTKQRQMTAEEFNNLRVNCGITVDRQCQVCVSTKIRKDGVTLTSTTYIEGQGKKKIDSLVCVEGNNEIFVAEIENFITPVTTQETYCVFKQFEFLEPNRADEQCISDSAAQHCWLMRQSTMPSSSCPLSKIVGKCIRIDHRHDTSYIIKVPCLKAFE